jgi:hypothetical protein
VQGDGQLVEHHQVIIARGHRLAAACEPRTGECDILRCRIAVDKAATPQLFDPETEKKFPDLRLAVLHRLDELPDIDPPARAQRPHGQPERRRGLALAVARVNM